MRKNRRSRMRRRQKWRKVEEGRDGGKGDERRKEECTE